MEAKTKKKPSKKHQLTFLEAIVRAGKLIDKIDYELARAKEGLVGGRFEIKQSSTHLSLSGDRVGITDHHISCANERFKGIADLCDDFDEITKDVQQQKLGNYVMGFTKTEMEESKKKKKEKSKNGK